MKKNNYIIKIISIIICLLPMLTGIVLYDKLPNEIPIHFDVNNIPDNYALKNIALFVIPTAMTMFQLLMIVLIHFTIKKVEKVPKIVNAMCWLIPIITILLYTIMISYSLGYEISVSKYVCFTIGILFCILGNYMPKMSYESAKSMMHPRPKNEKSHRKTVKLLGYSFISIGIIFIVMGFV